MKLLISFIIFLLLVPAAFAESSVSLLGPFSSGDDIAVYVKVTDVTDLYSLNFNVDFRANKFEFISGEAGTFAPDSNVVVNTANGIVVINAPRFQTLSGTGIISKLMLTPKQDGDIQLIKIAGGTDSGMSLDLPTESNTLNYDLNNIEEDPGIASFGGVEENKEPEVNNEPEKKEVQVPDTSTIPDSDPIVEQKEPEKQVTPPAVIPPTPDLPPEQDPQPDVDEEIEPTASKWIFYASIAFSVILVGVGGYFAFKMMKKPKHDNKKILDSISEIKKEVGGSGTPTHSETETQKEESQTPNSEPQTPNLQPQTEPSAPAIEYIKSCISQGCTEEQIKQEMRKQGWMEADISVNLQKAKNDVSG
jgi:hypothetical protein